MATTKAEPAEELHNDAAPMASGVGLWPLTPILLEARHDRFRRPGRVGRLHASRSGRAPRWITEETYKLSLALAQIMPGPLAAQMAIAIGYFEGGVLGATLVGLAFVLPRF